MLIRATEFWRSARIWSALATGALCSKDAAAAWALDRFPEEHKSVLARAGAIYLGDEEDRWDDIREDVRRYVEYVISEIKNLQASRVADTGRKFPPARLSL